MRGETASLNGIWKHFVYFNPLTPCGVRQHLCPKFLLRINAFAQNLHTNSSGSYIPSAKIRLIAVLIVQKFGANRPGNP